MKTSLLDILIAIWIIFAGAAFIVPTVLGVDWSELEMVARCVYVVVLAAGLIDLTFVILRSKRDLR